MKFNDILKSNISVSTIMYIVLQILLYLVGFSINFKIVRESWKTRDNSKTWQLHIIYSVSCTILFGLEIPFLVISNAVPNLSGYTGDWLCYLALFNIQLFGTIITVNSVLVAITKYIFIVHWDKATAYGHEKIQLNVTIFALVSSLLNAVLSTVAKDDELFASVTSCFGSERTTEKTKVWKSLFFCPLDDIFTNDKSEYAIKQLLQILCAAKSVLVYFMVSNLPEAVLYFKIFKNMKRSYFMINKASTSKRLCFNRNQMKI